MRPAASLADFVDDPVGRFLQGPTYLVWCQSPGLCGATHWDDPAPTDAADLARLGAFTRHPALAAGFAFLADHQAAAPGDGDRLVLAARAGRTALVVPPDLPGVVLAGRAALLGLPGALRCFRDAVAAVAWLGGEAPAAAAEVARLVAEARATPPLLCALRHYLDGALETASLDSAAQALGTSTRSLQRELERLRRCFSVELMAARVRAAAVRLAYTDEKIEAIARQVGWTSSQLAARFRDCLGETPSQHRRRARRRGGAGILPPICRSGSPALPASR